MRNLPYAVLMLLVSGSLAINGPAQDPSATRTLEATLVDLRSESVDVRRSAAVNISMGERELRIGALPVMIDLLQTEKDGQVRLAVLDALTAMGTDAAPAVATLVEAFRKGFGDNQNEKRHQEYRTALAFAAIGSPAVDGLRSLLTEQKESSRAEAVMALGRIGPNADAAIPDLILRLGDEKERVRKEASLALGRISTSASEALIAASTHSDAVVRAGAVGALGLLPDPNDRVCDAVVHSVSDSQPEVQAAAIVSLSALKPPNELLVRILGEGIRHEDEKVRIAVVNVLSQKPALLGQMASEFALLLTSENQGVARHAAYLIQRLGSEAAPVLLLALRDENSRIEQIGEALAHIGRPIAGLLISAIDDPDPRVQRGAASALGRLLPATKEAVDKLTSGLNHPNRDVQAACLASIGRLGPRSRTSVPAVRAKLRDESADTRLLAIDILFQAAPRDSQVLADFISMLDDASSQVQRQAIDTIRYLGPMGRRALPVVIEKLRATNPEVRQAAADMIASHGRGAAEAVPALTALLDDPFPELQAMTAHVLGQLGELAQPTLPRLISLLDAENAKVRSAVALAIGGLELDAEICRPHLAKALRDTESEVRRAGIAGVQRFGRRGSIFVPDIITVAENESERKLVGEALRRFERAGPDPRSIPELIQLLTNAEVAVRLLAIQFLSLAGQAANDAIYHLELLNDDSSEEIRSKAKKAIEQIQNNPNAGRRQRS